MHLKEKEENKKEIVYGHYKIQKDKATLNNLIKIML
jgi:hypothetical protein